ncbi:MAG: ATP-binding protein [Myxococcales bacterium]
MQLTELLFQRVKELGAKGQIAFRPGYVAVVSKASAIRPAILAALFPGTEDTERLALDPITPPRVALGFVQSDKRPYRLIRAIGGSRELHKYDAAARKFALVTAEEQEIDSFLRLQCGLPEARSYAFFVLDSAELPSQRVQSPGAAEVRRLEQELRMTREYEEAQDRLFRVQSRLEELSGSARALTEAEQAVASAEAELARSPWRAAEVADLAARAARADEDVARRDARLHELAQEREQAAQTRLAPPEPFWLSPWFNGGLFVGIAIDVVAALLGHPVLALLGLVPFAAALVAVLRFIQVDEERKEMKRHILELKQEEEDVRRRFTEQQAPVVAAMRAANVKGPAELSALLEQRKEAAARHDAAVARLEQARGDSAAGAAAAEIATLQEERARLEQRISAQGFARTVADIEADLHRAVGRATAEKTGTDSVHTKGVLLAAAELLGKAPPQLFSETAPRLAQFLAALTDRRIAEGKLDPGGEVLFSAPAGRTAALDDLPGPLRDLAYSALRLCLLEKVAAGKRLPVIVDDSFAPLDPRKKATAAKMLKAIAAHSQVIHRIPDAVPEGIADHVVQA